MKTTVVTGVLFFCCCIWVFSAVHQVYAAACPGSDRYAILHYNHQLLNHTISPTGTFSESSGLMGPVGIQIGPTGITNAGNNLVNRTINYAVTTPDCDCLSDTAESRVTVSVSGSCSNGVLNMPIQEVYPESSAVVTCTGEDSCPVYTQFFPGSSNDFTLSMNYVDGNTVVRPYTCANCSGIYSWQLQFTTVPPPPEEFPLVPTCTLAVPASPAG